MPRYSKSLPLLRHHRGTGRAYVRLSGKDCYCGRWDGRSAVPGSVQRAYDRLIADWLARGRDVTADRRPEPEAPSCDRAAETPFTDAHNPDEYTIEELIADFWRFAEQRYGSARSNGSGELNSYRSILRPLRRFHGEEPAAAFGPRKLRALRERLLTGGWTYFGKDGKPKSSAPWCRTNVNRAMNRLKRVFRWAVAEELLPPSVGQALGAVEALRPGEAPPGAERPPVRGVQPKVVEATLPHLPSVVAVMVQVQMRCGCRPRELVQMRLQDLDRTGQVWTYSPPQHKTKHHGHHRTIYLDRQAQELLAPLLAALRDGEFVFRPTEALAEMRSRRSQARRTPLSCGNRPGHRSSGLAGADAQRQPGACYNVASYRRAIERACARAGIPAWHPHQLRHTAARRWVLEHDPETARALLGHKTASMTRLYATDCSADRVLALRALANGPTSHGRAASRQRRQAV